MPTSPDPEAWSFLGKLLAAITLVGTAVVTPLWLGREWVEKRLGEKADKRGVDEQFREVIAELEHQRGSLIKLSDQARENEQRAQDRHERLIERLRSNGH